MIRHPLLYIRIHPITMGTQYSRPLIGRTETADFPDLGIYGLSVKIDTGAYNSSIHCRRVTLGEDGTLEVVFLDRKHPAYTGEIYFFDRYERKLVRSSNGLSERRYLVSTSIEFADFGAGLELSLTDRADMRYPVLIGRKFLKRYDFLVDPRRNGLLSGSSGKRRPARS